MMIWSGLIIARCKKQILTLARWKWPLWHSQGYIWHLEFATGRVRILLKSLKTLTKMALNKLSIDALNLAGKRVLMR